MPCAETEISSEGIVINESRLVFDARFKELSPWAIDPFVWEGVEFDSLIRFLSWMKARHYHQDELAEKIMQCTSPQEGTALVNNIGTPSDKNWNIRALYAVRVAYRERLLYKLDLLKTLAKAQNHKIIFASENKRWGTGLSFDASLAETAFPGQNLLGGVIEELCTGYFSEVMAFLNRKDVTVSEHDIRAIVGRIKHFIQLANKNLGIDAHVPEIRFTQRGVIPARFTKGQLRLNPVLLMENWDEYMLKVLPHEVAHQITETHWGRGVAPHGPEWASVMKMFNVPSDVCIELCTVNAMSKQEGRKVYACGCAVVFVTQSTHEEIEKTGRACPSCKQEMRFCFSETDLSGDELDDGDSTQNSDDGDDE